MQSKTTKNGSESICERKSFNSAGRTGDCYQLLPGGDGQGLRDIHDDPVDDEISRTNDREVS